MVWLVHPEGRSPGWVEEAGIEVAGVVADPAALTREAGLVLLDLADGPLPQLAAMCEGAAAFVVIDSVERPEVGREACRQGAEDYLVVGGVPAGQFREVLLRALDRGARHREARRRMDRMIADLRLARGELDAVRLQLIEAEKLDSIGRLAAGVAHELKNPLAIVSMGVEFLQRRHGDDGTTTGVLRELADAVQRAEGVIRGLLDYSAPRRLEMKPQDLNAVIRAVLRLVRGEIREGKHTVEVELDELPLTLVDRGKMMQVFVNLFTNALQAMEGGGTLTVRTRAERLQRVEPVAEGECDEDFHVGDRVVVAEISDTGPGIPPENLARIFEPFVTTKPAGKGTGLGLSVVRSIVNLHHGTIVMRNRDGGGATATLTLKVSENT